jgi:hypothetical protein
MFGDALGAGDSVCQYRVWPWCFVSSPSLQQFSTISTPAGSRTVAGAAAGALVGVVADSSLADFHLRFPSAIGMMVFAALAFMEVRVWRFF